MREGKAMKDEIRYDARAVEKAVEAMERYADGHITRREAADGMGAVIGRDTTYTQDVAAHAARLLRGAMAEIERLREGTIELPVDADGEVIRIGDQMVTPQGKRFTITGFCWDDDECCPLEITMRDSMPASKLRRARPDSWATLMADIAGSVGTRCESELDTRRDPALMGFVRRAEALAGGRGE